jgi:hypothetical protein
VKRAPSDRPGRGGWHWLTDDVPAVITEAFEQAIRRDPDRRRIWVVLVDGIRHQIQTIKAEADRRQVNIAIVVDFIHVLEYVWKAAWSSFTPGDAAAGIRRRATTYGYTGHERHGADLKEHQRVHESPLPAPPSGLHPGRLIGSLQRNCSLLRNIFRVV